MPFGAFEGVAKFDRRIQNFEGLLIRQGGDLLKNGF